VVSAAAWDMHELTLVVHIWYTEEPEPDKEGPNQTRTLSPGRPTAIGLLWSRLV